MQLLNLPDELLLAIGSRIQSQRDLEVLSRANRRLHNILTPELYHRDAVTQKSVRWAARVGRLETLQIAQSFGIVSDSDTGPLLHLAAKNGQVSILEYLLPVKHVWVNWVSCPQFLGDDAITPLAAACQKGHHGAVKVLLDHGADHTIRGGDAHRTPLHLAASFGCPIVVELLLDSGADISAVDFYQRTPLHLACDKGHVPMAKLLVDSGADVSSGCRVGRPVIVPAVGSNNLELVEFLLSKGCDPMSRTTNGQMALHGAARRHDLEMCKLLIGHGSQVSARANNGSTILDWAAIGGKNARMVTFLLEAGAEIGTTNLEGVSALHVAATHGPAEAVRVLINWGYDVNLKTRRHGYTPLYEPTCRGHVDIMQVLLDNGADVNAETTNGDTLLHAAAAAEEACVDAVRLLVEKGANTAARNRDGRSPLDLALSAGNDDVVELLWGKGLVDLHPGSIEGAL